MEKFILDTNICIFLLKGRYEGIKLRMQRYTPAQFAIPSIVRSELLVGGMRSHNARKALEIIEAFLAPLEVIPFCSHTAAKHAEIRYALEKAGKLIGPHDLIIAATALYAGCILVTHNTNEFSRVPDLRLQDWTLNID